MNQSETLLQALRSQNRTLEELLQLLRRDNNARRAGRSLTDASAARKNILALLTETLDTIRLNRIAWLRLAPVERQDHPEIAELLRENQNIAMKVLVLDKENEQVPSRHAEARTPPPAPRQDLSYLSRVYQRGSAA